MHKGNQQNKEIIAIIQQQKLYTKKRKCKLQ